MTVLFFKNVPDYYLNNFKAVRTSFDNLYNLLNVVEAINSSSHCRIDGFEPDFSFAVFCGDTNRLLVTKKDGYFSMALPFQVLDEGEIISFNFDYLGEEVSGRLISIMKNIIYTHTEGCFSHDEVVLSLVENFSLTVEEATNYYEGFIYLLTEDHGYFRFDDDPKNANGAVHPRLHFDFFFKNSTNIKLGIHKAPGINFFYDIFDSSRKKPFLG